MVSTIGGTRSINNSGLLVSTLLAVPTPRNGRPDTSTIESLSLSTSVRLPEPSPVLTVTVYAVLLPLTETIETPLIPLASKEKSLTSTPLTCSLKRTVKVAADCEVGFWPKGLMLKATGAKLVSPKSTRGRTVPAGKA